MKKIKKFMDIMQEKFNSIEQKVLNHLKKNWDDINNSIEILRKNDKTLVKSELCLAFIGADTFARFYEIMRGEENDDKENEKRFRLWLDEFVFTEKNEEYCKNKNKIKCDSATAWKLRNALLHFYGLPKGEEIFSTMPEDMEDNLREYIKKNKLHKSFRIINPYCLTRVILSGILQYLLFLKELSRNDNQEYIKGVLRCYSITQSECSVFTELNTFKTNAPNQNPTI